MGRHPGRRSFARPSDESPELGASELSHRLTKIAEAVCRHYLSNGRRQGNYWIVGDARNAAGRSMFVRIKGPETGKPAAGKWTDAATGEHGDLLNVIRESCGFVDFRDAAEEARHFLSLPQPEPDQAQSPVRSLVPAGSPEAARLLLAMSRPIGGTPVETYLHHRCILDLRGTEALRFHPRCYYRPDGDHPTMTWPAMIAAVTNLSGEIAGAHRTYLVPHGLDPLGFSEVRLGKAPVDTPRKAIGDLLGHAVRFGGTRDVLAAGEGIETMLSLRYAIPAMPAAATLSAGNLGPFMFPTGLRRLYVAVDRDPAGEAATNKLAECAQAAGIEALLLVPLLNDFNDDLRLLGLAALWAHLRPQLAARDVARFMAIAA